LASSSASNIGKSTIQQNLNAALLDQAELFADAVRARPASFAAFAALPAAKNSRHQAQGPARATIAAMRSPPMVLGDRAAELAALARA
jgi:hypothetical protein